MINLIFVCTGNTCRSPMAQGLLNKKAKEKALLINAKSAGLAAFTGDAVNENAVKVMMEYGIDISTHRARRLSLYDTDSCDYIVCMTRSHAMYLTNLPKEKIILPEFDIADPYGGDIDTYRNCLKQIDSFTDDLIEKLCSASDTFVHPMTLHDTEAIAEIEKECFSHPWSTKSIKSELSNDNAHFYVYKQFNEILGYIGMHTVLDECYIANIAVRAKMRKKNIGYTLVSHAINEAKRLRCSFITLEVRKSNFAAIALYEKCGFSTEGERKNFYRDPTENALIMTKHLNGELV